MIKNKHIQYPKTKQFREVISTINRQVSYMGLDENRKAIYDPNQPKPSLIFKGTVKLHGTNSAISYNATDGIYAQSKNNSFVLDGNLEEHMGFVFFVKQNEETFKKMMDEICSKYDIDPNVYTISIYAEWCGKGVQKKVAISEIDKAPFIFGIKISNPNDPEHNSYWVDASGFSSVENRIYNIYDFETFEVEVDFSMPQLAQNRFVELTEQVEKECPVAKALGVSGMGEGIVWSATYKDIVYRFKTKGAKHSVSRTKSVAPVDTEKLNSIKEFVEYSVTDNRIEQAIQETFDNTDELDITKMGDFLRWVVKDIMSEEMDTMTDNKLEPKDVNRYISTKAREMFMERYNKF